jgi:hypothetical protein
MESVSARRTADAAARTANAPTVVATACAGTPRPPGHRCHRCFGEVDSVEEKEGK